MIEQVIDIYKELKKTDKDLSIRKFSKDWLNASESYVTSTRYYGREIGVRKICNLRNNLRETAEVWARLYEDTPTHPAYYKAKGDKLMELSRKADSILFEI